MTKSANVQMERVADFSDPLFDSSDSIVDETDEDSCLQSDKVVPKMDRVPDFLSQVIIVQMRITLPHVRKSLHKDRAGAVVIL
ncbi:hypothetical protein ROHU_001722 [Labeo rohita]|uniref:Uncharacterized protein n=1 Tax=Labeo rohita TaxID=84645 RepID=A0A498NA42_LABRO|nr:hypothetical protein ROHU_005100 [Labeo rohita]RXN37794.1 hypothetical protein ROHU_001722 [Labeo rohita]